MQDIWRNRKNGSLYAVVRYVVNATNAQDGQNMVMYHPSGNDKDIYVREYLEFLEKFEPVLDKDH